MLMYDGRYELEAIPPDDGLLVVGVRPDGVEVVVGVYCEVGIVADEAAAKLVSAVDRVRGYGLGLRCCQVGDDIVEPGIVDVTVELEAVDSSDRGWAGRFSAELPRRDYVCSVG